MEKLIIDRSKWRTGLWGENATGEGPTLLLNESGYKCCLGFYCEQAGISTDLLAVGTPAQILNRSNSEHYDKLKDLVHYLTDKEGGFYDSTPLGCAAVSINDNSKTTPAQKEELITELFAKVNTKVEFINDYALSL